MSVHSASFKGNHWTLSYNASRLTLSREWGGGNDVFNFDHTGRPWNLFLEEVSYQRGLDNRIVAKWLDSERNRQRRWLSKDERHEMIRLAHQTAKDFLEIVQRELSEFDPAVPLEAVSCLRRAADYDWQRASAEAEQFHQIYLPAGILPPDQYMAALLQATEGCSFNQCTFCRFYQDRPFHIKSREEFQQHAQAVHDFIGTGLSARRSIFLGDANALVTPMDHLLQQFDSIHQIFDVHSLGGIFAFLDGFSGQKKSQRDFQALAARDLVRVYVGLESGHDPLLAFLNKPGNAEDAIQTVRTMKNAGISVGVIILLGAGGQQFAAGHVHDSIQAIQAMELDLHDQIYFSELVDSEGSSYSQKAFEQQLAPLTPSEVEQQWQQIQVGLQFAELTGTPHMARYDIREFIY